MRSAVGKYLAAIDMIDAHLGDELQATTHRAAKITALDFACEDCGAFHRVVVGLEDNGDAVISDLPECCPCGHRLNTTATQLGLIASARTLIRNAHRSAA